MRTDQRQRIERRKGFATVLAILCLAVASPLLLNVTRMIHVDQVRRSAPTNSLQANWLARHGLRLAYERLEQDPRYQGGHWHTEIISGVAPASSRQSGDVTVSVTQRDIVVTARYPLGKPDQVVKTIRATVPESMNTASE